MVGKYEITQGEKVVGTMDVSREGLYYRFRGKCNLTDGRIYRGVIVCGDRTEKLGVLILCNGIFLLDTRRPVKLFENAAPTFCVVTENEKQDHWESLSENTPFPKLADLENGVFQSRDGVPGILFTDPGLSPQDSDPNP